MFRTRQMLRSSRQVRDQSPPPAPAEPAKDVPAEAVTGPPPPLAGQSSATRPEPAPPRAPEGRLPSPQEVYHALVAAAQHVAEAATGKTALDSELLVPALRNTLRSLAGGDQLLTEAVRQRSGQNSWAQRVTNAALMAIRLGLEIDYNERWGLALGLCALMHDVGMLTIPREVLDSPRLTPEQLQLLRNHPIQSQKMVERFGEEYAWIGQVVVQVHERQDGSGYPLKLQGDQIHEFARIIGLADMYEAMAHPRADRKARVVYNALTEIIDVRNRLFDPRLIKALINIVSIFPLSSLVKLNNNAIGRVVGANKLYPTRPLVELLLDHRGRRLKEPLLLNLEEEPMLYIVDPAIDESVLEK